MPTSTDLAARFSGIIALQQEVLAVANSDDESALMDLIVKGTAENTSADGSIIELLHGDDFVFRAASGPLRRFLGAHIPREQSLAGVCIEQRDVVRSDRCLTDPRVDGESVRDMGIGSMAVAPLMSHDRPVGVLQIYAKAPEQFGDLDVYSLRLIAGMASSALMLAGQLRERRKSEERYRLLFERNVAGVFRTTLDGRILDCNDALVDTLGYGSRDELLKLRATDLYLDPSNREHLIGELRQDRSKTNVRLQFKRKDGSAMAGLLNISIVPVDGGENLLGTLVEDASADR